MPLVTVLASVRVMWTTTKLLPEIPMSAVEILPLSEVQPSLLLAYLADRGFSESMIQWKYFEESFNRGRERGYCAVQGGEMIGFMGVIPVELRRGAETRLDHWVCDWSIRDPLGHKGLGGAIAEAVLRSSGRMIAYGGTEAAKKRWRLKAASYDLEAGHVFRKHLTLGSYISGLQRRGLWPKSLRLLGIRHMPVIGRQPVFGDVRITRGVDPAVERLFEPAADQWRPAYSLSDLRWQLEHCPAVEAWTALSEEEDAAVLLWREKDGGETWKVALLARGGGLLRLRRCITAGIQHAVRHGGASMLAVISRLDSSFKEVLTELGFRRSGTVHPIHFLDTNPRQIPSTLERLSFLDSDDGYRF